MHGCIWFDHVCPPDRRYVYVAASILKSKYGIYLFGKVRRTDWRPVRDECDHDYDQNIRSEESDDDSDSEEEEHGVRTYIRRTTEWYRKGRDLYPNDYYTDSENSGSDIRLLDYGDLETYERKCGDAFAERDEDELWAGYNFEFKATLNGGLPDLSELS